MKKFKLSVMILIITAILCVTSSVFTTKGVEARDVTDTRYEVFFLGAPPGCSATTMTFRADQVLVFECLDGYGIYWTILDSFVATFWANSFYEGNGAIFSIIGIALDPFMVAGGIAIIGSDVRPVLLTGYLLSAP